MSGDPLERPGPRVIERFVALGDSFTAGNGLDPGRRWADLVAGALERANPGFEYFNLARDGATSIVVEGQMDRAIELEPDLISLTCGANDVILALKPDVPAFAVRFGSMLDRLVEALPGAAILTANYPEGWDLTGAGPRTQARINRGMAELNPAIRSVTAARGLLCLDVAGHSSTQDAGNFEQDGLHPSLQGHVHMADEVCEVLSRDFSIEIPTERRERIWS